MEKSELINYNVEFGKKIYAKIRKTENIILINDVIDFFEKFEDKFAFVTDFIVLVKSLDETKLFQNLDTYEQFLEYLNNNSISLFDDHLNLSEFIKFIANQSEKEIMYEIMCDFKIFNTEITEESLVELLFDGDEEKKNKILKEAVMREYGGEESELLNSVFENITKKGNSFDFLMLSRGKINIGKMLESIGDIGEDNNDIETVEELKKINQKFLSKKGLSKRIKKVTGLNLNEMTGSEEEGKKLLEVAKTRGLMQGEIWAEKTNLIRTHYNLLFRDLLDAIPNNDLVSILRSHSRNFIEKTNPDEKEIERWKQIQRENREKFNFESGAKKSKVNIEAYLTNCELGKQKINKIIVKLFDKKPNRRKNRRGRRKKF